ncbi:MAG: hypothetical protein KGJ86_17310 [Chloroflexota bacterium]|nr:hypothetical protein [Chloroflexota bacterium]
MFGELQAIGDLLNGPFGERIKAALPVLAKLEAAKLEPIVVSLEQAVQTATQAITAAGDVVNAVQDVVSSAPPPAAPEAPAALPATDPHLCSQGGQCNCGVGTNGHGCPYFAEDGTMVHGPADHQPAASVPQATPSTDAPAAAPEAPAAAPATDPHVCSQGGQCNCGIGSNGHGCPYFAEDGTQLHGPADHQPAPAAQPS